jgi:hypothetical protein
MHALVEELFFAGLKPFYPAYSGCVQRPRGLSTSLVAGILNKALEALSFSRKKYE